MKDHLNQNFPPRLPDGWTQVTPFSISKHPPRDGGWGPPLQLVAGVKGSDMAPHYFLQYRDPLYGRVHVDASGTRYVGVSP